MGHSGSDVKTTTCFPRTQPFCMFTCTKFEKILHSVKNKVSHFLFSQHIGLYFYEWEPSEMMNESKLTNFQQRHLQNSLRSGSSLPVQCAPTSSARPKRQKPPQKQSKIINPKTYTGGVRSKETMEAQGAFEKPEYVLPRQAVRSKREKEKLANIMAYGKDVDETKKPKVTRPVTPDDEPTIDRFEELKNEVEERQAFLGDMVKLGKGKEYKQVIDTEISQLVREMELIDKKRTRELETLIQKKEKEQQKS